VSPLTSRVRGTVGLPNNLSRILRSSKLLARLCV
jgi:hypothetical protein